MRACLLTITALLALAGCGTSAVPAPHTTAIADGVLAWLASR